MKWQIVLIYSIKSNNQSKSGKVEVYIDFDGNMVTYQVKDLVNIKHGFIISIHKAQGSEFDLVINKKAYYTGSKLNPILNWLNTPI